MDIILFHLRTLECSIRNPKETSGGGFVEVYHWGIPCYPGRQVNVIGSLSCKWNSKAAIPNSLRYCQFWIFGFFWICSQWSMSPETFAIGNLHQQTDWEGKSSKRTRHFQTHCSSGQEIALIDFLHIQIQKESCCWSSVRMVTCEFLRQSCLSRLSWRHGTRKRLNQQLQLFFVDGRTLLLRPGTMDSIERQWMVHFVCLVGDQLLWWPCPPLCPCFFKAQLWWVCLPL